MPVLMPSFFLPRNGASWYLLEDTYTKGGLRVVADLNDRAVIHPANLKSGMFVVTQDDGKLWQLQPDLDTWEEKRFSSDSIVSGTVCYTHKQPNESDVWVVSHNTGYRYFSYTAFDSTGRQVMPNEMTILNETKVVLTFSAVLAGHCTLIFDTAA